MSKQKELFTKRDGERGDSIKVEFNGCSYRIRYDSSRRLTQPKFYVQRMSDFRDSERYYSFPEGAFSALTWGRIKWVD